MNPELVPKIIAGVTLVAGAALALAPSATTRPIGLEDHEAGVRLVGLADLVLVPGLAAGRPASSWMTARAALSLAQAAYVDGVAPRARSPRAAKAAAGTLLGLAVMDASTAIALKRAGR